MRHIFVGSPPRATAVHFKPSELRDISAAPCWEGERRGGNRRRRSYREVREERRVRGGIELREVREVIGIRGVRRVRIVKRVKGVKR